MNVRKYALRQNPAIDYTHPLSNVAESVQRTGSPMFKNGGRALSDAGMAMARHGRMPVRAGWQDQHGNRPSERTQTGAMRRRGRRW